MSDLVVVLSTVPNDDSAEKIARALVDERLAACVNVLPAMTSIYRWKGAVERDTERQLVMKTVRAQLPGLKKRLRELHSYELPEFIVLGVEDGDPEYLSWVASSLE